MPSKKVPTLPPHSTYVLRSMAEHVGYEVQQMGDATKLIRAGKFPTDRPTFDRVVGNALLESVLIHVRSLDDFFRRTVSLEDDDVFAVHYLPTWSPTRLLTKSQRDKVNKSLAHLTSARATGPVSWPLDVVDNALDVFRSFAVDLRASFPPRFAWFKIELR